MVHLYICATDETKRREDWGGSGERIWGGGECLYYEDVDIKNVNVRKKPGGVGGGWYICATDETKRREDWGGSGERIWGGGECLYYEDVDIKNVNVRKKPGGVGGGWYICATDETKRREDWGGSGERIWGGGGVLVL